MNLFVGNLNYTTTEQTLREAFEPFGQVSSAKVIMNHDTGRSRGFGFVDMPNDDEAQAAMEGLNGQEVDGRPLRINEAHSKGGGGGGGGGGRRRERNDW